MDPPVEGGVKTFAKMPVSEGAEDLGEYLIIEGVQGDDIQVAGEAAWSSDTFAVTAAAFR